MDSVRKFPKDFCFGTATTAYQIEGKCRRKGESIWDDFVKKDGKIADGSNANLSCDVRNLYREDIQLMKELGYKHYHFSISWSRILPTGRVDNIDQEGIDYYNDMINLLIENDITPTLTLYSWDYPLALYNEYGGWLDRKSHDDFLDYAELCFRIFGDRVKKWLTVNEPWVIAILGHALGTHAPGRKDNPGTEPYIVMHNIILAHAKVVRLFRNKYLGTISIKIVGTWWHPGTNSEEDLIASRRGMAFTSGWTLDPIHFGDYPQIMKDQIGDRLPTFTPEEKKLIVGSIDFLALTHYTTVFAGKPSPSRFINNIMSPSGLQGGEFAFDVMKNKHHYFKDLNVVSLHKDIPRDKMDWMTVPAGIRKALRFFNKKYNYDIYVYENGYAGFEPDLKSAIHDNKRANYLRDYIIEVHKSIEEGIKIKGYFVWSLLDNFEWNWGYTKKFGLVHVDFETQRRTPKSSAYCLSKLCRTMKI